MNGQTMLLPDLLQGLVPADQIPAACSQVVTSLTCDSRAVQIGTVFFAIKGSHVDGHDFIPMAIRQGAIAIVLEDAQHSVKEVPCLVVANVRRTMAQMAARFFGEPTISRPLIGITGTNGKTTTTYLVESILTTAGIPTAVLGTISYRFGSTTLQASHTTPESTELQAAFSQLAAAGAQAYVMEVSSHALEQFRVDGSDFNIGVFTNLTRDHLDYHGTMEAYRQAKVRLFEELLKPVPDQPKKLKAAVINYDDPSFPFFMEHTACPVISYGLQQGANVTAESIDMTTDGTSGVLVTPTGKAVFHSKLLGTYNIQNILAAAGAGYALGLTPETIARGIETQTNVPGRLERVDNSCGITCLVDYAHTGDALENVLKTLKSLDHNRIITVFGCGGDRDKGKRPVMGAIATSYSDITIVTSDNPRTESASAILEDIIAGITGEGVHYIPFTEGTCPLETTPSPWYTVVENRRDAIWRALALAKPGDIVLIAGKGHEDYQIIGTEKTFFDDRLIAREAIEECQHAI